MGRKRNRRMPGLVNVGGIWHIDKRIKGHGRLCESTSERELEAAQQYLIWRLEEIRRATVYGIRPKRTFRQAATKYLREQTHKRSLDRDARALKQLEPHIGDLALDQVHNGSLAPAIRALRAAGQKPATVTRGLAVVRRILTLASRAWRDECGLTWLDTAPLITLLPLGEVRKPYPLSWDEQRLLFAEVPAHLARMALFKVNSGTREQEVCGLRWEWEVRVPELETSIFIVPGRLVKNGEDRVIVLNRVACSVVEECRGKHRQFVFTYKGEPVTRMMNSAWRRARREAAKRYEAELGVACPWGFAHVRVHDLKHTFGRRLRAAGVALETRRVLLGHKNEDITTHYSAPEIADLLKAAERIIESRKTPEPQAAEVG